MTHWNEVKARLSYLGYQVMIPTPALQPYVQCYWLIHSHTPLADSREEFLHPTGGFGIMFNLGDAVDLDGRRFQQECFLGGTNTATSRLHLHGRVEAIGIRFQPGGAYPFLQQPL